jgi:AAA+ ATPase superfamily predicted ATPase
MNFLCKDNEKEKLEKIIKSDKAELVAVLGIRRIGKTFCGRLIFDQNLL